MTESQTPSKKIVIHLPGARMNKIIPARKLEYALKLRGLLDEYDKCMIVTIDNVGSRQIADMRKDFRGRARFLFGKNTLIRKVLREYMKDTGKKELMPLMEACKGNIGFVFTKESIPLLRKEIMNRKRQSAAKAGVVAPVDVFVPAGPTGMEPTQTQMFQAMDIPTRINRGQIDITSEVHVVKKGEKVGASEASLLIQLSIRPFYYGMLVRQIYQDGEVYAASVIDITNQDVAVSFYNGLQRVAAFCFEIDYPTIVNVPHSLLHAYKKTLALGLGLDTYSWDGLALIKEIIANPELFASGGGGGGGTAGGGKAGGGDGGGTADGGNVVAAVEEPEATPEPSPSPDAAPNMFGAADSSDESSDDSDSN